MTFQNEREFEAHIREVITKKILPLDKQLVMIQNKKAVDILICRNGKKPALYFIEIKYHKNKHGRLCTGHGKGGGIQPEILQLQPDYFKKQMRWILGAEYYIHHLLNGKFPNPPRYKTHFYFTNVIVSFLCSQLQYFFSASVVYLYYTFGNYIDHFGISLHQTAQHPT